VIFDFYKSRSLGFLVRDDRSENPQRALEFSLEFSFRTRIVYPERALASGIPLRFEFDSKRNEPAFSNLPASLLVDDGGWREENGEGTTHVGRWKRPCHVCGTAAEMSARDSSSVTCRCAASCLARRRTIIFPFRLLITPKAAAAHAAETRVESRASKRDQVAKVASTRACASISLFPDRFPSKPFPSGRRGRRSSRYGAISRAPDKPVRGITRRDEDDAGATTRTKQRARAAP
jgi:hypothetical protein